MGGRAGGGARGGGGAGFSSPRAAAEALANVQAAGRRLESAHKAAIQAQWAQSFGGDNSPKMQAKVAKTRKEYLSQQKAYNKLVKSTKRKFKAYNGGDVDLPF